MIRSLCVALDRIKWEVRRLELLLRVKLRLVEVMGGRRIGVLAEDQDRPRLHFWTKIHYADKRVAGHAVAALLIFFRPRVEIEYDAHVAGRSRHGQAFHVVAEGLFATRLSALKPVEIPPQHLPGARA